MFSYQEKGRDTVTNFQQSHIVDSFRHHFAMDTSDGFYMMLPDETQFNGGTER